MNANHTNSHANGPQALKDLVTAVKVLTRDPNFEFASTILEENARLSKQIESQEAEIKSLAEREKEQEAIKATTYREILDVNEKEKSNNTEARKQIKILQTKIQETEQEIAGLQKTTEDLRKEVREAKLKYSDEKKNVVQAHKDISGLQKVVKDKDTLIDEYKTAGTKLKRTYEGLQIKFKEMETSKSTVEEDMRQKSLRLAELESYTVQLNDDTESVLQEKFFDLWEYCIETMVIHLGKNIPKDRLQDPQAMKKLKMPSIMPHQVPLPPSNTNAAKQVRLAVFMGILSRELADNIFQPFHVSFDEIDIRDMFVELALKDPKKESFCRAVLLAISPEKQNAILEERKKAFLQSVGSYLFDLFPAMQHEELRQSLKLIVDRACETWRFFQYSRNRYEPDHELLEWRDGEWEPFPFTNNSGTSQDQDLNGDSDEPVLAIFPRLCRVGNEGRKLVNIGTVLTRSQCLDAERELKKKEPSSPRVARANSDRQRTRNMSISFGHSPDQNGSFLGHGDQANN